MPSPYPTLDQYVFSTAMEASPHPEVTLVRDSHADAVALDEKRSLANRFWQHG